MPIICTTGTYGLSLSDPYENVELLIIWFLSWGGWVRAQTGVANVMLKVRIQFTHHKM